MGDSRMTSFTNTRQQHDVLHEYIVNIVNWNANENNNLDSTSEFSSENNQYYVKLYTMKYRNKNS